MNNKVAQHTGCNAADTMRHLAAFIVAAFSGIHRTLNG
ncbi:hypothetical protein ECO9389_08533 [Escherichia coli O157:H- str. 493-89]|nr:hypothetical protein ECO9389_08533 [Escherichia coli O157:H- str. 493-89]